MQPRTRTIDLESEPRGRLSGVQPGVQAPRFFPASPRRFGLGRSLLLVGIVLGAQSCAPSSGEPSAAPPRAPTRAVERGPDRDPEPRAWGVVQLSNVPVRLHLPDPGQWHAKLQGSFTVLTDRTTVSRLVLRVWSAPRLVTPSACEADARLRRPTLPAVDGVGIVDARRLETPPGYDARLTVGVEPKGQRVHGYALAVGAAVGRCYVAVYETWASGRNGPDRVAERLALMVPGVIETLRIPTAAEARPTPLVPE